MTIKKDDHKKLVKNLQTKLLDLSRKNNLINYKFGLSRSRPNIRIIDEIPDIIFSKIKKDKPLSFKGITQPQVSNPADELNESFRTAVREESQKDVEYQKLLLKLKDKPNQKEQEKALDQIRDRVRVSLNLLPVDRAYKFTVTDEAKKLGINTSEELELDSDDKKSHTDNFLQTLMFDQDLDVQLSRIYNRTKLFETELGVNTLFLVFGFLSWYESESSTEVLTSPLLIMPVQMTMTRHEDGTKYSVENFEEDPETNLSLKEKLKNDFGIILPDFKEFSEANKEVKEGEVESTDLIKKYLLKVEELVKDQLKWSVLKRINVSVLSFQKISLYKDLDTYQNQIDPSPLVMDLMGSKDVLDSNFETDYNLETPEMLSKVPPIVTDADSSQISAIIDSLDGKNMVIEGPPGTGKSQTITNIIASLLNQKKTVLFVAEKKAALSVVKKRLDKTGIGDFSLELHSNKVRKSQVVESIRFALAARKTDHYSAIDTENINRKETEIRQKTESYIHFITLEKELSEKYLIRDLIGRFLTLQLKHPTLISDTSSFISTSLIKEKSITEIGQLKYELKEINRLLGQIEKKEYQTHPLYQSAVMNVSYKDELPVVLLLKDRLEVLNSKTSQISELKLKENTLNDIRDILTAFVSIPLAVDISPSFFEDTKSPEYLIELKDILSKIISLKEFVTQSKRMNLSSNQENLLSGDLSSKIKELVSRLEDVNFTNNLDTLQEETLLLKDTFDFINSHKDEIELLAREVLKYQDPLTSDELRILISYIESFSKITNSHIKARTEDLFDEDYQDRLDQAYAKKNAIEGFLKELSNQLDPELLPEDSVIRESYSVVKSRPWYFKITPTYFRIKNLIKTVSINKKLNFKQVEHTVNQLYLLQNLKRDFVGFNVVDRASKENFDRVQKQFEFLGLINQVKTFLNQRSFSRKLGQSLKSITTDDLGRIKEFIPSIPVLKQALSYMSNQLLTDEVTGMKDRLQKSRDLISYTKDNNFSFDNSISSLKEMIIKTDLFIKTYNQIYSSELSKTFKFDSELDKVKIGEIQKLIDYRDQIELLNLTPSLREVLFKDSFITDRLQLVKRTSTDALIVLNDIESRAKPPVPVKFTYSIEKNLQNLEDYVKYSNDLPQLIKLNTRLDRFSDSAFYIKDVVDYLIPKRFTESDVLELTDLWQMHSLIKELEIEANVSSGESLNSFRQEYFELDSLKLKNNSDMVKHSISGRELPVAKSKSNRVSEKEGVELINHLLSKPGSRVSLRELLERSGQEILQIMPCFMMSPLSVAQFLPQDDFDFDVLIIDEASQVKIEDILSSVIRAKQIIVVGDNKQLPPTSFFQSEENEEEDLDTSYESILDMTEKAFSNKRRLKWHYRSQNEQLIKFSNSYFYDNDLILFPASLNLPGESGLVPVKVNGIYESNKNKMEATQIVEAAIKFIKENPDKSLGLVAVNKAQADYIEDLFEEATRGDIEIQEYLKKWEEKLEEFFIKNLENVQGDERDAIFISMVYGKDSDGNFFNRFGPINSDKGHRRLNVLFSRAKILMKVFYSIPGELIAADDRSKEGVKCLKAFIRFLDTGLLASSREKLSGKYQSQTSEFEDFVVTALEKEGYLIERQVGESGYFIDIAIKDPKTNSYILGIECDGATYHSSKYMRDRDKTRQMVLERLGWKIVRIWSTDWFKDPTGQINRIKAMVGPV